VIVTLTLNPALHVGYRSGRVGLGRANEVSQVSYWPGGRGLAVARTLHTFGHEVVAAGLAGGASGEVIRAELARAGVATQFTPIAADSRQVLEVTDDATGAVTTFREPAPYITTEELGRLAADYRALMTDATAAVLCGSLPAGLPAETYGSLASYAADAGVPVVLDAAGRALWHGAARRPALVIPEPPARDPAGLLASGVGGVALLLPEAVRVVTAQARWRASLAAGSGRSRDALVAGFVPGIALGWSWPDMLRHAVALMAAVRAAGEVDLDAYEAVVPQVAVKKTG